ncbi:MAG: DNA cytosine methyltransferase [Anaerolineae bacterium]|nr:DNA cytosine methyltransferase [Anaerolineae bacterium]NUQ05948.1 DNA cytosine methyltransferase [Anaerolineae bacterium]
MTLDITALDLFCGAGGSSTGMVAARVSVQIAINHWRLAIDTHAANHPATEHDCADVRQTHPSYYPRTTIFWASPECTNHSVAKGRRRRGISQLDLFGENQVDPAEERSRATMREVVEFAEYHRYEIVIVENVVDIRWWSEYESWLQAMINLGYEYRALYLNAQFFAVPQSRNRIYVVFWRKGNRAPDLDFRPPARCERHGQVAAVQSWKRHDSVWGSYRKQYVYRCPHCAAEVQPAHTPAYTVIDWSLPAPRIGDRDKPLKPKTMDRIRAGLRKFALRTVVLDTAFAGGDRAVAVDAPLATQTARQTLTLLQPFLASQHGGRQAVRETWREMPCITTMNNEHALVVPPFIVVMKNSFSPDGSYTLPPLSMGDPLTTIVASGSQHALIAPPFLAPYYHTVQASAIADAMPTITATDRHALVIPQFHVLDQPADDLDIEALLPACGFRMLEPTELKLGMSFPGDYVVLGSKKDQVRQIGNAVACNVAKWIVSRCVESLS